MDDRPVERPICFCGNCVGRRDHVMERLSVEARTAMWQIYMTAQNYADRAGEPVSHYHVLEAIDFIEFQAHSDWVNGVGDGTQEGLDALDRELTEILP